MNDYKVRLKIFEGPLDLLLYLIKKNEVSIYDIPIAEITKQYLEYLKLMQDLDLDIVGDFLVMAATLLYIKSRMLLPQEEVVLDEEIPDDDPREELVNRLMEYKKFKEAAGLLKDKEEEGSEVFKRYLSRSDIDLTQSEDPPYEGFEASIFDLISAFTETLKNIPKEDFKVVLDEEHTVEEKMEFVISLLDQKGVIYFNNIWGRIRSRIEAVVFFLSLLELIRLKKIIIRQIGLFGEIKIFKPLPVLDSDGK
ncbi:MAG: segregation/condensation protein A [Candidatus Kaelpia imicola]|nr:segregation/condensation protein A [Candidatus Kaelpia imicola]